MKYICSIFYVVVICLYCAGSTDASVEFDHFLGLFENCTVKLYNYGNLHLSIRTTPVSLHTGMPFRIERRHDIRTRLPFHCLALFYILPRLGGKKPKNNPRDDRYYDSMRDQMRPIDTKSRYDILVDNNKVNAAWNRMYDAFVKLDISSYGLVLTSERDKDINQLRDEIQIVNRLQLTASKFVMASFKISQILQDGRKINLDKLVEDVNDRQNNWDVSWNTISGTNPYNRPYGSFLDQHSVSSEGAENYVLARIALGDNVTVTSSYERGHPSIIFDVPHATLMKNPEKRGFGFVTCANLGIHRYYKLGFIHVLQRFVDIFEPRIYYSLLLTYLGPAVWLGITYHSLLKDGIQKDYWLKWDPFTWGIRALIRQAGDRRWNSKRFGFMTWIVTPWLLGAIVISYSFQGSNIMVLNQPSVERISSSWTSFRSVIRANVIIVTDHKELGRAWKKLDPPMDSYRRIAEMVDKNTSLAYVTYEDRATAVAKYIGGSEWWNKDLCSDWSDKRKGVVQGWDVDGLPWNARRILWSGEDSKGWKLSGCGDVRLIRRIQWMEGPSGIVMNYRRMVRKAREDTVEGTYYPWIESASMLGNIKWLFAAGGGSLGIGLITWILEWLIWKLFTQPMQRRQARFRKKQQAVAAVVKPIGVAVKGICSDWAGVEVLSQGGKVAQEADGNKEPGDGSGKVDEAFIGKIMDGEMEKKELGEVKKEKEDMTGIFSDSEEEETSLIEELDALRSGVGTGKSGKEVEPADEFAASFNPSAPPPPTEGVANDGVANDGVANDGVANYGVANDGVANDGVANYGVANDGVVTQEAPANSPGSEIDVQDSVGDVTCHPADLQG